MFAVETARGKVVIKQSDAPWSEAAAAAIGSVAGVPTIPAVPIRRPSGTELPFDDPRARWLLVLPWIDAPTLADARTPFDARALGRLWAFDVLIDNSDRMLKGGNPRNLLVGQDGTLFAIDQRLGPAITGRVDAARVTRRRLASVATAPLRERVACDLFDDFRRQAPIEIAGLEQLARAFSSGVSDGIRAMASLDPRAVRRAVAGAGAARRVRMPGLEATLQQFREVQP